MSSEERAEELAAELWADNKFQGWRKDFAERSRPAMLAAFRAERLAALEEAEAAVKARMEIERVTDFYGYDRERNNEREYIIDCIRALKGEK